MIHNKKILTVAVLAALALFNVSCKKSNGGGFIASAVPGGNGKATLGFQIKCDNILHSDGVYVAQVTGNVQYNDHPAGVKVHGALDFIPYDTDPAWTSCEQIAEFVDTTLPDSGFTDVSFAVGTYGNNAGDQIAIAPVELTDTSSCPSGKGFIIQLSGTINYSNEGCLDGGNLTIF